VLSGRRYRIAADLIGAAQFDSRLVRRKRVRSDMTEPRAVTSSVMELAPALPARRVLFGPLPSTDVCAAVVRRFCAAIALGLLADGDRLPKEADLAAQLGITTFSLREALGQLREQGLVVTRAGKYGGSFIRHTRQEEDLEHDELLRLSAAELRDLGDWRLMLAAQSAVLAARRGTRSNGETLHTYARRVGTAADSQEARRAHGRFHVELASAAQSMRMTRAEFAVHEEIDWLFGLALETSQQRAASARGLGEIAAAVQHGDAPAARNAAERYSLQLVRELAQLRLALIAERQLRDRTAPRSTLDEEVAAYASAMLTPLEQLAITTAPVLDSDLREPDLRSRASIAVLQCLGAVPAPVKGVGVLAEVGVVPGHRYWTEYWDDTASGPAKQTEHVMDPAREDFYDFAEREYIAHPRQYRAPWATGPFVDYGGADDYIITFSVPMFVGERFVGISAADVLVADLEQRFSPWLATEEGTCVLLNAEQRVIVSNSVAHSAGDVVSTLEHFRVIEFPMFGWSLARSTRVR
jgi:DNA-binding FadR family transcriptional regulator